MDSGRFAEARDVYEKVKEATNIDIAKISFEGPEEILNETQNTQLSIFTESLAIVEILKKYGIESEISTGLSLGEYTALVQDEVFDFETGAKIVKKRGEIMKNLIPSGNWKMAAILGLDDEKVEEACKKVQSGFVVPANYNTIDLSIIAVAIVVKLILGKYVKAQGEKANSGALIASGSDASFDAVLSASVLVSAIIFLISGISLEAYVGVVIAVVIIKASIEMMRETLNDLIGHRTDAEISKRGIVRIGIGYNTPPMNYLSDTGKPEGFDVDIAKALAEKMGYAFTMVKVNNKTRITALVSGADTWPKGYDLAFAGFSSDDDYASVVRLLRPAADYSK